MCGGNVGDDDGETFDTHLGDIGLVSMTERVTSLHSLPSTPAWPTAHSFVAYKSRVVHENTKRLYMDDAANTGKKKSKRSFFFQEFQERGPLGTGCAVCKIRNKGGEVEH